MIVTHANVVDVLSGAIARDTSLAIRAGVIERIGPNLEAPEGAEVIDATGKFLIPGLWDMHVHMREPGAAFHVLIANGVTSVRDMYSGLGPREYAEWRTHPDAVRIAAAGMIAGPEREAAPGVVRVNGEEDARLAMRLLFANDADFVTMDQGVSREVYFAVADEARRFGKNFAGPVPDAVTPAEAAQAGQLSQESLDRYRDEDTVQLFEIFAESGMFQTPLLARVGQPQEMVRQMKDAGVHILAGSGGAPLGSGLHDELELLVASGLTPLEAIQAATLNPATYFGMLTQFGRVERGKSADLVLLDANPLEDIRNTRKVHAVFVRGKYYSRETLDGF